MDLEYLQKHLEEAPENRLTARAGLGLIDEIKSLRAQLTTAQSERDEARAKLASLVPGKVRIPELTKGDADDQADKNGYGFMCSGAKPFKDGVLVGHDLARTHAEVVVEAVALPDAPDRKTMDPDFDVDGTGMSDCDLVIRGYNLAVSRIRTMQQVRETK